MCHERKTITLDWGIPNLFAVLSMVWTPLYINISGITRAVSLNRKASWCMMPAAWERNNKDNPPGLVNPMEQV